MRRKFAEWKNSALAGEMFFVGADQIDYSGFRDLSE